jgi:predicted  nucleic acid-binding Zn-ribbon protein
MGKKKTDACKTLKEELQASHDIIAETIVFWEGEMDKVVERMNEAEEIPDWHPNKEDSYHELNLEMQFILKKLEAEESEINLLEERTNRLLAEKLFKKFKRIDGD